MDDLATLKFRHSLPYAIFPASPPLAALHAARARSLHSHDLPQDPLSCSRCGSLLSLQHSVTLVNKKRSNRIYRRSCYICGTSINSLLPKTVFPPTHKHGTITALPPISIAQPPPQTITQSELTPNLNPRSPSSPQPTATTRSRPKKKSGLHQLLARNRENEEKERQRQKQSDSQFRGLAAFLSDLH